MRVMIRYYFTKGFMEAVMQSRFVGASLFEQIQEALADAGERIRDTASNWEIMPNKIEVLLEDYEPKT